MRVRTVYQIVVALAAMTVFAVGPVTGLDEATAAGHGGPPFKADPCGEKLPKPTGGTWTCTLADNFDGFSLNRKLWTPLRQPGPADGSCAVDSPRTVQVSGGMLRLSVVPVESDIRCPPRKDGAISSFAGASVSTWNQWSQQYGRFEVRMMNTASSTPGLQEIFWLWPDDRYVAVNWPATGEIDIVETYSQYPDLAVPFLHYTADDNGGPRPGVNTAWNCVAPRGVFHTYTLEWTADRLEIFVDGQSCLVNTAGAASFRKRFIVTLTQALGLGANAYTGQGPMPATTLVDYVKVWR